jgi:hypothetical protein
MYSADMNTTEKCSPLWKYSILATYLINEYLKENICPNVLFLGACASLHSG